MPNLIRLMIVVGFALLLVGCDSGGVDIQDVYGDFKQDPAAAKEKYKGKTVPFQIEKVLEAKLASQE